MSTHRVVVTRTIDAPLEQVWEVVDDTSRYAEWVAGALEVTHHHGRATVGQTYAERNRTLGPLTARSTWTVRRVEPRTLRVDTGEGLAPLQDVTNTFRFEETDGATTMTYEVTFRLRLGPLGRVVGAVLQRSLGAEFARSMASLDHLLRSERPPRSLAERDR